MMSRTLFNPVLVAFFVLGPALMSACSAVPDTAGEPAASGSLSLPLTSFANGHRYRVSNAFVYVQGPQYVYLRSSDDPSETVLSAPLTTGDYWASLWSWSLEREDDAGTFVPVQATLTSSSQVPFTVFDGAATTISYQFQTDGVIVNVGSGDLRVAVNVQEIPAVCTPFGSECGEGAWCPPTGLTGRPRACYPAGSIALGEPCNAVTDCVPNASCADLGEGPVCLALCRAADFDLPCASGGSCQPAGSDYGVCRPSLEPGGETP